MADLDLDIITQKQKTVRLFGRDVPFKTNPMRIYLANEARLEGLNTLLLSNEEELAKAENIISEYLLTLLELTKEEADEVSLEQFQALKQYMEDKGMKDQGFSDKEIRVIKKKQLAKQIESV